MPLFRRKRADKGVETQGEETYARLRAMALEQESGVVVDIPAGDGQYATVVAMGDNSTSMYTSVGGGTIGAGEHAHVAAATQALQGVVREHLNAFAASSDTGHPGEDAARIFVLAPDGRRVAEVPIDAFWGRQEHPLVPVIAAIQNVITAMRQIENN